METFQKTISDVCSAIPYFESLNLPLLKSNLEEKTDLLDIVNKKYAKFCKKENLPNEKVSFDKLVGLSYSLDFVLNDRKKYVIGFRNNGAFSCFFYNQFGVECDLIDDSFIYNPSYDILDKMFNQNVLISSDKDNSLALALKVSKLGRIIKDYKIKTKGEDLEYFRCLFLDLPLSEIPKDIYLVTISLFEDFNNLDQTWRDIYNGKFAKQRI